MFLDLQGCAGCLAPVAAARMRHRGVPGLGALSILARGRTEVAIERERRATLALVLGCLPAGWCVIDRDPCGRERFTGPVAAAPARSVKGALW